MKTLLLDATLWDLVLDSSGNIAVASDPYSVAQDVASAIRLFSGELWYDTTKGIPYWEHVLGLYPPLSLLKQYFTTAALTVPNVGTAQCFIQSFINRVIVGQVQVTDTSGTTTVVQITPPSAPGGVFVLGSSVLGGTDVI